MTKIMIIDDDRDMIDSLKMILEGNDYEVCEKTNIENLVESIEQAHPDIILLDIVFPDDAQAGFKAARSISRQASIQHIPVLILSAVNQLNNLGFSFSENDISGDFMPVSGFLDKPVRPDVLLNKLRQIHS